MFIPHARYSCMLQKYNYSMQWQICPMSPEIQHNIDMSIFFMYIHILPISIGYFHSISFGLPVIIILDVFLTVSCWIKVNGPRVQTFCIEKDSYMEAI